MDLIEISSSDSDFDMDNEPEIVSSSSMVSHAPAHGRRLPSWASALGPDLRDEGYGGKKRASSPKKIPSNRETSSYATFRSRIDPDPDSSKCGHIQAPSSSIYSHSDVSGVKACNLQSSEEDDNRHLSTTNQSVRRSLPASFQHSLVHYKKNNSRYNVGNSHSNGWSYSSTALGLNDGRRYAEDSVARDGGDDVIMLDHKGSRILPPSLMRGRPVSATNSAALSDPVHHLGLGEEGVAGNERLIFQSALQDLNQPKIEADIPDGILSVPLLRHQKIALAWMLQKESRTTHCVGGILADDQGLGKTISTIALIQMQRSMQSKSDSVQQDHETEALNLDDDDDNNVASSENTKECAVDNGVASLEKLKQEPDGIECSPGPSSSKRTFRGQRPAAGTLIVCPATVLRQWERELKDKVTDEAKLSVLVYHGGNRTKDPSELAKHDVVLTTYSIVTNEVPKQPLAGEDDADKTGEDYGLSSEFSINKRNKRPSGTTKKGKKSRKEKDAVLMDSGSGTLARVSWFRVVLDEAQCIKNYRTQAARACCGLRAKRRWCLSGTPIQNAIDELYSYFRFLRYEPYSSYNAFSEGIKIPISRDSKYGYKKLQAILKTLLLRRTKDTLLDGQPIISLPPKFIEMKRVSFTGEERSFYAKLEAESRSQFKAYAAAGTLNQNYANILLMLLRLRQACDHPFLVKGLTSESVHRTNLEKAKQLPKHTLIDLFTHLDASTAICQICRDPAEDAVITMCSHVFCYQCVSEHLNGDDNLCPASRCRKHISADVLFSKSTLRCCLSDEVEGNLSNGDPSYQSLSIMKEEYISSKIKAALQVLKSSCKFSSPYMDQDDFGESDLVDLEVRTDMTDCSSWEGPTKAIVFSQWTTMLNLFQSFLQRYCIPYRRLDGTMSLAARDKAVREFNSDPEVIVMLMSLKAGNLGLNMVAACHVILLDLWWNPTTEDQAVDRAHRIGQTRPVTISRITIKDTVEDRILALQEEKRKMVASAFGEDHSGGSATRLTAEDLRYLFLGNP